MEVKNITFRVNSEYYRIVLNAPIVGSSHDELRAKARKEVEQYMFKTLFMVHTGYAIYK